MCDIFDLDLDGDFDGTDMFLQQELMDDEDDADSDDDADDD
ncbi:MAG: hypothetical protein RR395_06850 [Ruthenibacterium sp.]